LSRIVILFVFFCRLVFVLVVLVLVFVFRLRQVVEGIARLF